MDEIFRAEPEGSGHWNLKAATLGRLGDFGEAIELYENMLSRAPESAPCAAQLRPHVENGWPARCAVRAYRKTIGLDPCWARHGGASRT